MHPPAAPRVQTRAPQAAGSTVITVSTAPRLVLRVVEAPPQQSPKEEEEQHVRWAEDVVDNEGMGKKSSKVCCIYHRPHDPDASDSSESSDSSDSDSEGFDDGRARPAGGSRRGAGKHKKHHHHDRDKDKDRGDGKAGARKPSPNAYERMPRYTPAGKKQAEAR